MPSARASYATIAPCVYASWRETACDVKKKSKEAEEDGECRACGRRFGAKARGAGAVADNDCPSATRRHCRLARKQGHNGPEYACRVLFDNSVWQAIAFEDGTLLQPSLPSGRYA